MNVWSCNMSYYHLTIEINEETNKVEERRDIEYFNIEPNDLNHYITLVFLPYLNQQAIEIDDEFVDYQDLIRIEVKHTVQPIEVLIEEEQKELPSDTDITITAKEIFNDHDLSQDITVALFDILTALTPPTK